MSQSHINTFIHQNLYSSMLSVSVFFYFRNDTHSCAAMICRVGAGEEGVAGVRRNNQQGNHFQLRSCTAWLARSQVSPERVGSPLLLSSLSSLLSLPNPHTQLSPTLQSNRREEGRATKGEGQRFKQQRRGRQDTFKDAKRVSFANGSLGYAREVIPPTPHLRRKQEGGRALSPRRMRRQKSTSVIKAGAFELELKPLNL